jgi:hypothetical protein
MQVFLFPLKGKSMNRVRPGCYGKCKECFFYYINGCVALPGEDCFIKINNNHALLIIKNQKRFDVPEQLAMELTRKFSLNKINSVY